MKAEKAVKALVTLGIVFVAVFAAWMLSIFGLLPLTYVNVTSPAALAEFLASPRDDMRGVKVNGHLLEIGKRPALQIIREYDEHLYLLRPYRGVKVKPRNMTRYEVMDFCTNITGADYAQLRNGLSSGAIVPVWQDNKIRVFRVALFSYLVEGLLEQPIFIAQTELAQRLGVEDRTILARIVPAQKRWYAALTGSGKVFGMAFPVEYRPALRDELIEILGERSEGLED